MAERFLVVPAVYIVLKKDTHILLLQRANTGYGDGLYCTPAGHIDGNESAVQAAAREAAEEVGVTIAAADLQFVHVRHRRITDEDSNHERVDFYFMATTWQGEPYNAEPHKAADVRWFDLKALPENLVPSTAAALREIELGNYYSDENFTAAVPAPESA